MTEQNSNQNTQSTTDYVDITALLDGTPMPTMKITNEGTDLTTRLKASQVKPIQG